MDSVIELSKSIGVSMGPENIAEAFFLRNRKNSSKNEKKSVIVKFSTKSCKDKLMSAKSKLKENENMSGVYVNDYLSRETLNLFNYAKALKEVGYQHVFARNGRVLYKRSDISRPQVIRSEEDVDKILLNATTNKPYKRRSMVNNNTAANGEDPGTSDDDGEHIAYVSP